MRPRSFHLRAALFALLGYFLLTLVLTYPLVLNFTTHVAGDGSDDPALAWNLWWVRYALLDLGASPIYTNYLFFPIGLNLGFYTLTYLNAFLSIPIQFAFGLIPAANVNLVLSFTLSGFGMYLLSTYLLRRDDSPTEPRTSGESDFKIPAAAFAAGLVYAFAANKYLFASLGQFNIASSQWIPFYLLFLFKVLDSDRPRLKHGFLLGFFLLAQALSEFIFASFLVLFTAAYLIYWLISNRFSFRNQRPRIINLLLAGVVFLVPMLPILAAMAADTLAEGDFIQQGLGFSDIFSADLLGFFIPSHLHPLFGSLESLFAFPYINFMFLGFAALLVAILALVRVPAARIWGLAFALIFLITLGPTLRINGREFDLPMPFDLLLQIPLVRGNRYPSRWGVMLVLCLAILVGYGLHWILEAVRNRKVSERGQPTADRRWLVLPAALCLLLVFESLSVPLPLSDLRVPQVYSQIASEPGNWSVMEIPLAWRNGFRVTGSYRRDSQAPIDRIFMYAQWYQSAQEHPILNGNTSRNPELKFQYFAETPVLDSLVAIQTGHTIEPEAIARDLELAPRLLQFFGTRFLIWHAPFEQENREVAGRTRAYIEGVFPLTRIGESYEDGRGVVAYRVDVPPADDSTVINPDDPLAGLYFGEGWSALGDDVFWVQRPEAKLFVPVANPQDMRLILEDFKPYPSSAQGLRVRVNDQEMARENPLQIIDGKWSTVIPAGALHPGLNEVTLVFDRTLGTSQLPDPPISILVRSAGEEQGAFGHIYVNGQDESPNASGYNVVVVDSRTGKVQDRENFDTFLSGPESTRLAEFIRQVPEGDMVAVAASDDASMHLTEEAFRALREIGAEEDLRGKFRWSHAVIGVKGAPPGSASEMASETRVSQASLNAPLVEPRLAASIGQIRFEPTQ